MKIGQNTEIPAAALATAKAGAGAPEAPAAKPPAARPAQGTAVTVSKLARSLEESNASGSFDAEKVAAVKASIENGTYKVDAGAIADKLLANARQVLRGQDV